MRKIKTMTFAVFAILIISSTSISFADSTLLSANNGTHGFSSSWSATKSSDNNRHHLTYGFDTTLINEDFAYANSISYIHRSKIINGNSNGPFYGPWKAANAGYSDKEVRHKGSSVKYYCLRQ